MDAWLFLSTLALLWGPVHVYLTKRDLVDLKEWVGWVNQHVQDVLKEARAARVDDEMVKLRQRNVKRLARYFTHLGFVTTLGFSYDAVRQPGQLDTIIWALISFQCYVQNVMVGKEFIQISPGRLKFFTYTGHITCLLLSIITGMSTSVLKFAAMHSFDTALRFVIVFIFLDPSVSIPFQLLYTTVDMLIYVFVLEGSVMQVIPLCFGQFFICALSIASSIFLDLVLRGRIDALLDTADAESLVSSFRRVLRGVCDGEVLLDSRMNVTKDSECLKHLILTNVSLTGKCFQDLLADEEERRRFTEFIHSSTRTFSEAKALQSPPVCLRVSLLGSEGIRVAADLYHVPVPGLFGVEEASHLIAFKEDPEPRPAKAAQDGAVPAALLPAGAMPGMWHGRGRPWDVSSVWSGSTGRSSANHVGDVALQEMFLLVDADTELQDVEQVEVNFKRHEELDLPTALHSGMPSLRKLVQPMDWGKVRSRVSRFVEKSLRDEKVQSKTMNPMTVQLPGLNGWLLVDEATVHRNQGAKVWLHLRGFRPVRRSRPDPVRGIPESSGVW